jgi:hypothetical protein
MRMNALLDSLLKVLKTENSVYQSLYLILQQQRNAVVECEVNALNKNGDTAENLLSKLAKLETQRTKATARLAASLAVPQPDLTLKKIVRLIHEPYSSELRDVRAELIAVLQGIQKASRDNLALFKHSHELMQDSLALLSKCILNSSVYYRSGKIQNTALSGTLLSGEI